MEAKKRISFTNIFLIIFGFIFLFTEFIANDRPIFAVKDGQISSPVINSLISPEKTPPSYWKLKDYDLAVWPLIRYSPQEQDLNAIGLAPFQSFPSDHFLGTDHIGRDVFANLIYAIRTDLTIAFMSMLIAVLLGLFLGVSAGYWGNRNLKLPLWKVILSVLLSLLMLFWLSKTSNSLFTLVALLFFLLFVFFLLPKIESIKRNLFPVDNIVMRGIEIFVSIPTIFIILFFLGITGKSMIAIVLVIGLTRWTGIARLARAETLKAKENDYVKAGRVLGLSNQTVMYKHILPNILSPILVAFAFGVAGAILIQGFLSFIGVGLEIDTPSLGRILNDGHKHNSLWWLSVFPGLIIFCLVYLFNKIGEKLS